MPRGNANNLRAPTSEEARERGRKGGIKSGEVRRARKNFKDDLLTALEIMQEGKTLQEIGVEAIVKKFMDGDIKAFEVVRDTIGEKPTEKIDATLETTTIAVTLEEDE